MENIQKESISGAHPLSHLDTSFFHSPHTLTQRNRGSHGNFYEVEQEQCRSVPVGALCGGLGISQWHKLCWSRAGVTLAGTTGQPRSGQEVFLVPPPTPAYLLRLHIYISAFVFHFVVVFFFFVCFSATVAMLGATLTPMASLFRGESTPHISALVQFTLQMVLKPEGYITLLM